MDSSYTIGLLPYDDLDLLNDFVKIVTVENDPVCKKHLEVCGNKFPMTAKIGYVLEQLKNIKEKYGQRSQEAEHNKGVDYKALYHAVRVGKEALELLTSGKITMPRPEKDLLLAIRKQEISFNEISKYLDQNEINIKLISNESRLPEQVNKEIWDNFICRVYQQQVMEYKWLTK